MHLYPLISFTAFDHEARLLHCIVYSLSECVSSSGTYSIMSHGSQDRSWQILFSSFQDGKTFSRNFCNTRCPNIFSCLILFVLYPAFFSISSILTPSRYLNKCTPPFRQYSTISAAHDASAKLHKNIARILCAFLLQKALTCTHNVCYNHNR